MVSKLTISPSFRGAYWLFVVDYLTIFCCFFLRQEGNFINVIYIIDRKFQKNINATQSFALFSIYMVEVLN